MVNYIEAARKCLMANGCNGCPLKGNDRPCAEAFAEYITKCVEGIPNLTEYIETGVHENATIITADGVRGSCGMTSKANSIRRTGSCSLM